MDIQTEKERNPPVRNIERDSPETQVDTETFENQFGLKTAKESGIQTFHNNAEAEPEKKPETVRNPENPDDENPEDTDSDSCADTGEKPKKSAHSHRRMGRRKKKANKKKKSVPEEIKSDGVTSDENSEESEKETASSSKDDKIAESSDTDSDEQENSGTETIIEKEISEETDNAESGGTAEITDTLTESPDTNETEFVTEKDVSEESNEIEIPEMDSADDLPDAENPVSETDNKPEKKSDKSKEKTRNAKRSIPEKLEYKKYITAKMDSEGSETIEMAQAVADTVDSVIQTSGTIRTAVSSTANGIGKIHTVVKQGLKVGSARDIGNLATAVGSGLKNSAVNLTKDAGTQLLKTQIDKSTITDTGTETIKQGLTELRYADNTRRAIQNTARGAINTFHAVRSMPSETKAQVQRIRNGAKKTVNAVRKVVSSKMGLFCIAAVMTGLITVVLANGLTTITSSSVTSLFSWMFPDGVTSDTTISDNISTYLEKIQEIKNEKQAEIDEIVGSLSPEYKHDGSVITGLNKFGNSTLNFFDDKAVLAVLATQKFHSIMNTDSADFHFTEDEIRTAVEQFYEFNYYYKNSYCPSCDCTFDSDCLLSLSSGSFSIIDTWYNSETDRYSVKMQGTTYSHASAMTTRLEVYTTDNVLISGNGNASVGGGVWTKTYNIASNCYDAIDWNRFYLTVTTTYCNNPNHKYLYGSVINYSESDVLYKAGFSEDEKAVYRIYLEQINAMGG